MQDALEHAKRRGAILFPMPFFQLLQEFAQKANDPALSRLTRMINVMALSASMAIMDFDSGVLAKAIQFIFRTKKKVADLNVQASVHTYNYAKAKFAGSNFRYRLKIRPAQPGHDNSARQPVVCSRQDGRRLPLPDLLPDHSRVRR